MENSLVTVLVILFINVIYCYEYPQDVFVVKVNNEKRSCPKHAFDLLGSALNPRFDQMQRRDVPSALNRRVPEMQSSSSLAKMMNFLPPSFRLPYVYSLANSAPGLNRVSRADNSADIQKEISSVKTDKDSDMVRVQPQGRKAGDDEYIRDVEEDADNTGKKLYIYRANGNGPESVDEADRYLTPTVIAKLLDRELEEVAKQLVELTKQQKTSENSPEDFFPTEELPLNYRPSRQFPVFFPNEHLRGLSYEPDLRFLPFSLVTFLESGGETGISKTPVENSSASSTTSETKDSTVDIGSGNDDNTKTESNVTTRSVTLLENTNMEKDQTLDKPTTENISSKKFISKLKREINNVIPSVKFATFKDKV